MDYLVRCEHCGAQVISVPRIGEAEAALLRQHLRGCPSARFAEIRWVLSGEPGTFAELLRHFRVASAEQPTP